MWNWLLQKAIYREINSWFRLWYISWEAYAVQSSASELLLLVLYRVCVREVRGPDFPQCPWAHHTTHMVQNNRMRGFTFHQLLLNNSTSWNASRLFWKMHICPFVSKPYTTSLPMDIKGMTINRGIGYKCLLQQFNLKILPTILLDQNQGGN